MQSYSVHSQGILGPVLPATAQASCTHVRRAGGFPEETDTNAQPVKMYAIAEVVRL